MVFPETATNSYQEKRVHDDRAAVETWTPRILDAVGRSSGPWVVLGTFTYQGEGHQNSALLIDPQGTVRGTYHKISDGERWWLLADIKGVLCSVVICADFWVPAILHIPKMLGAQVCLYPHASGAVAEDRRDWSALYYTRAWESKTFLVMADCSWFDGEPFERPETVAYPYDFTHHQLNQSCIIDPEPRYLARAMRDEREGLLIADIDPKNAKASLNVDKYAVGGPWTDMLKSYEKHGYIKWVK